MSDGIRQIQKGKKETKTMAHNITLNAKTNKHEFFSRGAAWHGLGQNVETAQNWAEAQTLAGLDWKVEKRNLQTPSGLILPDTYGVFRNDLDELSGFLGVVGSQYEPIQNENAFAFVDDLLENADGCHFESAGSLNGGKTIFCLAKMPDSFDVVAGDKHETYLAFCNSHDGKKTAKTFLTSVRIVCNNTLNQALSKADKSQMLSLKHTANVGAKMMEAQNLLYGATKTAQDLQEKLRILSGRKMTKTTFSECLDSLFGESKQAEGDKIGVFELFERNDSNAFPEIRGTAYNLLNAVTEYFDHEKAVRVTNSRSGMSESAIRSQSAFVGANADKKTEFVTELLSKTRYAETVASRRYSFGNAGAEKLELTIELSENPAGVLDAILDAGLVA